MIITKLLEKKNIKAELKNALNGYKNILEIRKEKTDEDIGIEIT